MADVRPPIIVLTKPDDRVGAFFTTVEALGHMVSHRLGDSELDFFDGAGRRVRPRVGTAGFWEDLEVESEVDHSYQVRERVRGRSQAVRGIFDAQGGFFPNVDDTPLTLADQDMPYERFAWMLASVLRPHGSPADPQSPVGHSAGWWHNLFGH